MDQKPHKTLSTGHTRREALKLGLAGMACAACGASGVYYVAQRMRSTPLADVFKHDAPSGELWDQWQKQGWAREARHYLKLGQNIQCKLCPNECVLEPEDRGHCRNRVHKDGKLYTLAYADPCAAHVDPIEKKPLFHFLPDSSAFSLATAGCGLRCLNCQNWDISQSKPEETKDPRGEPLRLTLAQYQTSGSADVGSSDVAARGRGRLGRAFPVPFDRLHLLRADRLVRVHARHREGGPGEEDQELLDHLRLDPGGAACRSCALGSTRPT